MDLTEIFERLFTGKHFTSDADFDKACGTFRKETGCRFARRHMIYRQKPLEGLPNLLLKQGQFTCSVSYCDAFFSIGSKKSGVYVTRFNMHHIHGPMPEETYDVVCDLTNEFRQFFPVDMYETYDDFHSRLVEFQSYTGSSYVKRHTVRWPADAEGKQHLVYARAHFECVRYGWSESNTTSRPVVSKRIGCKAYVVIQTYKGVVEIFHLNMQHNHEISSEDCTAVVRQQRRLNPASTPCTKPEGEIPEFAYLGGPVEAGLSSQDYLHRGMRKFHRRRQQSTGQQVLGVAGDLPALPDPKPEQPTPTKAATIVDPQCLVAAQLVDLPPTSHTATSLVPPHSDPERFAILSGQLDAIRQLAADFYLVDQESDLALEMCEELRQIELDWRRRLMESAEQQEAAPILVEFATTTTAAAATPTQDGAAPP